MIDVLFSLELLAGRQSRAHHLDAWMKIIVICAAIVAMVSIPYSPVVYTIGIWFLLLFIGLYIVSSLPPRIYFSRLITAIPFGFMICGFQIFFTNLYYTEYHVLYALPLWINIFFESVLFASILLVKFFICFSSVSPLLFSSHALPLCRIFWKEQEG
jgi:cobalt/nickel transport system permease protein